MRIGFDISQTGAGKAGCGYYADAMIRAMLELAPENAYSLFPSFGDFYFDPLMPVVNPYGRTGVRYGPRHLSREQARSFWKGDRGRDALSTLDIVHANNFWCPIAPSSARVVFTLHDMAFAREPDWTTERNRQGCFDGVFRSAVAADWIVAISQASREDYLTFFPSFPEDRVRVVHPCSRFTRFPDEPGTRPASLRDLVADRFWLCVGTVEPRKNQRRLAEAYASHARSVADPMPLVMAGGRGWLMEDFASHLEQLGVADRVRLAGYVSDEELVWLYRNCYANLFPSLFEGFGLPILEGMQFGAATIASDNTSIPEVTGDAALLLPAEDVDAWACALTELHRDPARRARLSELARRRAEVFDWKRSAAQMLGLYDEAIRSPKRG